MSHSPIASPEARERADKRAYLAWLGTLSPIELAKAQSLGVASWLPAKGWRTNGTTEDALDIAECEVIPEGEARGRRNSRPMIAVRNDNIDAMEPENSSILRDVKARNECKVRLSPLAQFLEVDVEDISEEAIHAAEEDFSHALRWAFGSGNEDPVSLGRRTGVVIAAMRNDLAAGLEINGSLGRSLLSGFQGATMRQMAKRLSAAGKLFGRLLRWLRHAGSLSALGSRLKLVLYQIRPDWIDGATLRAIGKPKNYTRQAVNKLVNELRETMAGLKSASMRGAITRVKCKFTERERPSQSMFAPELTPA